MRDSPYRAKLTELAVDVFEGDVREARSLQHTAVGWLYAIERRGNAREFLWQAQIAGFEATAGKVGLKRSDPAALRGPT